MSVNIPKHFVQAYNSNLYSLLAQQKGSRLRGAVRNETFTGEYDFLDQLGAVTAVKRTGRHTDTPQIDTPHERRRLATEDYEWADLIDKQDKLRMLLDPTGPYAMSAAMALGRSMDDAIIDAAFADAPSGKTGSTLVSHPNSQKLVSVSGGAGVGMNVASLRALKRKLDQAEVDESIRRYICLDALGFEDLLAETEVSSADFNTVRALVRGEIDEFMGFKFIRSERLLTQSGALAFEPTDGSVGSGAGDADGYRRGICWAEDGIALGVQQDIVTRVDERSDKSYATQVYAKASFGAVRMEEVKVIEMLYKVS